MAITCIVYVAEFTPDLPAAQFAQIKDRDTRLYGKHQATGVRIIANGFVFEVIEATSADAEQLLDQASESPYMGDPEILIFAPTPNRQFHPWKIAQAEAFDEQEQSMKRLRDLGAMALQRSDAVPSIIAKMLGCFDIPSVSSYLLNSSAAA
jgi:hypothetical protein